MIKTIFAISIAALMVGGAAIAYDHANRFNSAPTLAVWVPVAAPAPFDIRDSASALKLGDRYILSGGFRASDRPAYRDIWSSTDGANWTLENESAPIDDYAALVSDGRRVLAIGSTVWAADGDDLKRWAKISDNGPNPTGSTGHAFWLADRIVFIGPGFVATSSDDGVSWTNYSPPFAPRTHHSATLHNGRIFLVAGADETLPSSSEAYYPGTTTYNDVWSSTDGLSWELVTPHAQFSPRMWPALVSSGGRLILAEGFSNEESANLGDVWTSKDGRDWERMLMIQPQDMAPKPRHFPSSYPLNDGSLLIVAGNAWPVQNDVWRLELW